MAVEFAQAVQTPWGTLTALGDAQGICRVTFEPCPEADVLPPLPWEWFKMMEEYLSGQRRDFPLPQVLCGPPDWIRVWYGLMAVPYGETTTVSALAERLNLAEKTVEAAAEHCPNLLIIPVHRLDPSHPITCFERENTPVTP